MKPLIIKETKNSPKIELKDGEINFSGCSIINDPKIFFEPVISWLETYSTRAPEMTFVNIDFEYIDSASIKTFFDVLKILEPLSKGKRVEVNWYYDLQDPETLELGELIEIKVDMKFNFLEKPV